MLRNLTTIQAIADRTGLPDALANDAIDTFSKLSNAVQIREKDKEAALAACVFIACRKNNVPRTLKEISSVAGVSKRELGKQYLSISKALDLSVGHVSSSDFMVREASSSHILLR